MPPFDGTALAKEVIQAMKSHVDSVVLPLKEKIAAQQSQIEELKKRTPEKGEQGAAGKDGKDGADGKSLAAEDVRPMLDAMVANAMGAIRVPENGKDGKDGQDGKDGVDGKDGKSFTIEEAAPLIEQAVTKAVAGIRVPADGKDGNDGKDGKDGKDAVNLASAMIDRNGCLVLTLSDGKQVQLGAVVGRDGAKGDPGKDGSDGLGFDDLEVVYDGERTFGLRFTRGEKVKEFTLNLPIVLDRGVWKEGKFEKGDGVTWGGSFFIAQCATETKPETSDHWRLSVKRGRDGRSVGPDEVKTMIERAVTLAVKGMKLPEQSKGT